MMRKPGQALQFVHAVVASDFFTAVSAMDTSSFTTSARTASNSFGPLQE